MPKYLMGTGIQTWKAGVARTVSFVVTEDCNLRCRYCYMVHKNDKKRMSFETAKHAVDFFLHHDGIQLGYMSLQLLDHVRSRMFRWMQWFLFLGMPRNSQERRLAPSDPAPVSAFRVLEQEQSRAEG
jgi:hypothetical protein